MVARILKKYDRKVKIAVVGKYVELHDAYISIAEALKHAAVANEAELEIKWVNSEKMEEDNKVEEMLKDVDGILLSMQGRTKFRSSASALACSAPLLNMRATCAAWKTPTVPSLHRKPSIRLST